MVVGVLIRGPVDADFCQRVVIIAHERGYFHSLVPQRAISGICSRMEIRRGFERIIELSKRHVGQQVVLVEGLGAGVFR